MINKSMKIRFMNLLIIAAVFNLSVIIFSCEDSAKNDRVQSDFSKVNLSPGIDSILYSFALKKSWIRNKNFKDSTLLFSKEIQVPDDLPLIELNYEISDFIKSNGFDSKVTEEIKTGNLMMNIFASGDTLRKAVANLKFIYSDSAKRSASIVCIVLDSIEAMSLPEAEKILNSTQQFSVLLPLRNDKAEYQSEIIESKRSYLVAISTGGEDDIEADLKEGMSQDAIKTKVRSLSMNFTECSGYILSNSNASEEFVNLIKEEFAKNNLQVYEESMFDTFKPSVSSKVISLFENIILRTSDGKKFLIYRLRFSPEEFDNFDSQAYNMKKLGYRFMNFKDFMRRKNNVSANKPGIKKDTLTKSKQTSQN